MPKLIAGVLFTWILTLSLAAQQAPVPVATTTPTAVPRLVKFSGSISDANPVKAGVVGVTFALYRDETGGAPLWIETQSVQLDAHGHYTVQLGASKADGIPLDLFTAGEARWLGVRPEGQPEQPRVLLVSVPYALKAADADTIGGRPASAFVLAPAPDVSTTAAASPVAASSAALPPALTGAGTTNFVPLWTPDGNTLGNSVLFQSGSGSTAKLGINTTTPTSTLDVKGTATVRGIFSLPAGGVATATAGKNSQAQSFTASAFNSGTSTAVNQSFRVQAEPAGNNTPTASGTLNLLFGQGTATPTETGLKIASNGRITFAAGQTFPGTGSGTVKNVAFTAPASDFNVSGSPVTSTGTLGLTWNVPPTSANTANAIVKRDSSASFNANNINLTGTLSTTTSNPFGILASTSSTTGAAIEANATATTGGSYGVYGSTAGTSLSSIGVYGVATSTQGGNAQGVTGVSANAAGIGVLGRLPQTTTTFNTFIGANPGVWADGASMGLMATSDEGYAVYALNNSSNLTPTAYFESLASVANYTFKAAGQFGDCRIDWLGDLACTGTITGNAGFSKIDHPLDPANKYLVHSSVQSPEEKTVYDGVVALDASGEASVKLPDYVEALNGEFRYQLTCLGAFAPVYIAQEISNHQFRIAGGKPGMKVSWQVTGIRHDAYTKSHPHIVEPDKPVDERGYYLHPEAFGQPHGKGLAALESSKQHARMLDHRSAGSRKP